MYQNYQYEVDPKDPFKPLYQGTFEETVEVGGKTRRYLLYIPVCFVDKAVQIGAEIRCRRLAVVLRHLRALRQAGRRCSIH